MAYKFQRGSARLSGSIIAEEGIESTTAATVASMVCTAGATFGGGYGATGVSISTAGAIQMNNKLTVDGDISGSADSTGSFGRVDTVDGSIFGNRYVLSTCTLKNY